MSEKKKSRSRQLEALNLVTQTLFGRTDKPVSLPSRSGVRDPYENFPRPFRDPEDDRKRMLVTPMDDLAAVNRYCWRGRRDFDEEFRILVVDDGTGDAAVFLAVQAARLPKVEIVYLAPNAESGDITRRRLRNQAERLGLPEMEKKVDFRLGSLLEVESVNIGRFDYIHCGGVSHRLDDPSVGLRALAAGLRDGGVMGVMVHAEIGRAAASHVRDMMRIVHRNETDVAQKIRDVNRLLEHLPSTNLYRKSGSVEPDDLLLLRRERTYTFTQLVERLHDCGLHLNDFVGRIKAHLMPEFLPGRLPRRIRARLAEMAPRQVAALMESLSGSLDAYEFYVSQNSDTAADLSDEDLIPSFSYAAKRCGLASKLNDPPDETIRSLTFSVESRPKPLDIPVDLSPLALASYPLIDDERTIGDIARRLRSDGPQLVRHWKNLLEFDRIHLRHVSSNVGNLNRDHF